MFKIYILIVTIISTSWMFNACKKQEMTDPFWQINLNWEKDKILERLSECTKSGEITNCVFSFEKTTYIKNNHFDAKIICSLNIPQFTKNLLKQLSYTLMINFKNEQVTQFNPDFYEYFKKTMKGTYGSSFKEELNDDEIVLKWLLKDNKKITVKVLKTINYYTISINI